jgi:25S rRNA (uracil2634-N3)-methyltransferase
MSSTGKRKVRSDEASLGEDDDVDTLERCLKFAKKSILSVGSGDGSQQAAILKSGHKNITTTFYDSRDRLLQKYAYAVDTIKFLESDKERPPKFGIDATKIDEYGLGKFDVIMFTFPHTGVPTSSPNNVSSNQYLLRSFLASATKILEPLGEIQITLKSDEHYKQWQLPLLIEKESNVVFKRTHVMKKSLFPGYVHRPTLGTFGRHLTEVLDRKGAKVHVFVSKSVHTKDSDSEESNVNSVSIFTPDEKALSDDQVRVESISILDNWQGRSPNILEIRNAFEYAFPPDTRQLNRVLYQMERDGVVKRDGRSAGKPDWELKECVVQSQDEC